MKTNLRSVLMLAVVVSLAAMNTGCTAKMKKAYHESRADKYFAAGQYDSAEVEYLNVLRNDNGNAKAFARLGTIFFEQGRYQTAEPFLARASFLATNDLAVRLKWGFVQAASGKFKEAHEQAIFILDHDSHSVEAPLLLVQSARTSKEIETVRSQLQKYVKAGDTASLQVALGQLAFRSGDTNAAATALKRALTLDPKSAAALESMGALYAAQNDLKNAELNLKAASELSPARSTRRMLYARFKFQTGDLAAARQVLEDVVKVAPDYIPALMGLGELALAEKKYDVCRVQVDKVLAREQECFDGLMLDGRLRYAQGDFAGVINTSERMAKMYPQVPQVQYQLGAAYFAGGEDLKAIASLNRALELDANYVEASILLARIQIKNQNLDPVILSMNRVLKQRPKLTEAQLLLADAYRLRGNLNEALAIYLAQEKLAPTNAQITFLAGAVFLQLNDRVQARAKFEHVLALAPENVFALQMLVGLDLSDKDYSAATQRIQARLQQAPRDPALYLLTAKVQLAQGDSSQAEQTLLKALAIDPQNNGAYQMLADIYSSTGQNAKAIELLQGASAKNPKNLVLLMQFAAASESTKDYQGAAATYEKMLLVNPKCSPALNNLAYLYSEHLGRLDRAYELAQQARELLPYDPSTADTLGWISLKRGAYPAALTLIQESADKMPTQPEVQFHLGMANYMMGREVAARTAFQRALQLSRQFNGSEECQLCLSLLDINPQTADATAVEKLEQRLAKKSDDPVALVRLAAVYLNTGKQDKAIATYEALLKVDVKNVAAMTALAGLYETKDAAKAYGFAKSAYKLASDNAYLGKLYGRLAYRNGDFKLANAILQEVVQKLPGDGVAQFDYARAAYSLGKVSLAQAALQSALTASLPAKSSDEARRMLECIALAANPQPVANTAARVTEILTAEPDYVPALMVQVKLSELAGKREVAISACEKILARLQDFSPAQRELAILYSSDSTKAKTAYALAMKARDDFADDSALAKAIGIIIFQQGDFARAATLLKACAASSSTDPEIFYYLGAAQLKAGQRPAAKANLQQAIALKLSGPLADSARQMLTELK